MEVDINDSRIIKLTINDIEYIFWKYADIVKPYIKKYLTEKFPNRLIIRELNMIDLTIPEENLPIEIQATPIYTNKNIMYSEFENDIRKQIEQNIISYDKCWFFFDSSLLKSMQDNRRRYISINMDWFRKFIKEEKLKAFTVSHDGIIEEKEYKDFDFLSEMSQTCKISHETDDMILNGNKMKIFTNVVKGYGFLQNEIDIFYYKWQASKEGGDKRNDYFITFLKTQESKRAKLYGNILKSINTLYPINNVLSLNVDKEQQRKYRWHEKWDASILGIFDMNGSGDNSITSFVDRFDLCKYFPGYLRNKDTWDKLRGHNLYHRQFENIVMKKTDINKGVDYFWYERQ